MSKFFAPIVVAVILILSACGATAAPPAAASPVASSMRTNAPGVTCEMGVTCSGATGPNWTAVPTVADPYAVPLVINPKTVANAVDANKARAERDWNGRYVQFTAEVTDISTFISPSVQFGKVSGQAFSLIHFLCMPADEAALIPYSKGENATVRGVVEVGVAGVIKLNDCQKVG